MTKKLIYRLLFLGALVLLILWGGFIITANVKAAEPAGERVYVSVQIKAQDTLWSIAEEYCQDGCIGDYVRDLKEMNGIVNDGALKPGAYLLIYQIQ